MDSTRKAMFCSGAVGLSVGLLIGLVVFVIMLVSQNSTEELYRKAIIAAAEGPLDDCQLLNYDGMKIHEFWDRDGHDAPHLLLVNNPVYIEGFSYSQKQVVINVHNDAYKFFRKRGYVAAIEYLNWQNFQKKEREKYSKPTKDKDKSKEEY